MIARTARLLLTELKTEDAPFILKLVNEPGWIRFIGDRGIKDLKGAENYIITGPQKSYAHHGFGLFKVSLTDGTPIGMCGLLKRDNLDHPDIGFAFLEAFTGQGYALEAAKATMEYAMNTLKLSTILGITMAENTRSVSLLEKLGMHYVKMIHMTPKEPAVKLFST
jgi:RimJ/RimL family protein N-acetyltransferase